MRTFDRVGRVRTDLLTPTAFQRSAYHGATFLTSNGLLFMKHRISLLNDFVRDFV